MKTVRATKQVSFQKLMVTTLLGLSLVSTACSKSASFSLMSESANFQQNASETNGKIDVLFVIDNSGSMQESQQDLADNMHRFIEQFASKGFDYRLAVTTTDAWRSKYTTGTTSTNFAKFKDGVGTDPANHTGVFVVTPETVNGQNIFLKNIMQGINGNGDERAFQSMETSLTHAVNDEFHFPRPDAFLSVIILSDEEDFSNDESVMKEDYNWPTLKPVDYYVGVLDAVTMATPESRSSRYNVNSISITNQACLNAKGGKIARRYIELASKTNGISGSLCEDFGTTLADISHKIVELITQFYLDRVPQEATLRVFVNGSEVPKLSTSSPQPWNGFFYHSDTNSITFHGNAVPPQGASISVKFDPLTIK